MTPVYSPTRRALHWATAALVLVQLALAAVNAWAYESRPLTAEAAVQAHMSVGALTFVLTLWRLGLRAAGPSPAAPADLSRPWRLAAGAVHWALYACLLALPVTGYVKLAALGFEIVLFGAVPLPPLALDPPLALQASAAHDAAAWALGGLLAGHAGAALLHRRLFGDPVLPRMTRACRA